MQLERERSQPMIPEPSRPVATIVDHEHLATFAAAMAQNNWIAIDTEFLRERTYYPKLCLVQIADRHQAAVIDVLAIDDLSPLVALLTDPALTKVFHSAEQDLEVLLHTFGQMPAPVFDTQLGAPLIGLDDQIGYARLVEARAGVSLSKAHTRTDWSKRPLPAGALDYAADDVRYLAVIYPGLVAELESQARLAWAVEDNARLVDPARFSPAPETAWRRVKAWVHLPPAGQQILAALCAWREHTAIAKDRPRRWILADDILISLAEQCPTDAVALADTPGLPEKTLLDHGDALLAAIAIGRQAPAEVLDVLGGPPDAETKRQIKVGTRHLNRAAKACGMTASTLGSRSEIARIVAGTRDVRLLTGWRADVAGHAVRRAIESAQRHGTSDSN